MGAEPTDPQKTGASVQPRHPLRLGSILRVRETGVLLVVLAMCAVFSFLTEHFLSTDNLLSVARQISETSIMAIGMTYLIVTAEFDLSVGSIYGICAIILAYMTAQGYSVWLGLTVSIVIGALIGMFNGALVTRAGIPSFIVTLGMMGVLRGLALVVSGGWPISEFDAPGFFALFSGELGPLPAQVIWMVLLVAVGSYILGRTVFGHRVYAVGGNPKAAILSGISVANIKLISFTIMGALAAVAGALMTARLKSVTPLAGTGLELDVIAAVVIGGTSLFGGSGSVIGSWLGAIIMGVLRNGLVLLGVSAFWQQTAIGATIVIAVGLNVLIGRAGSMRAQKRVA